jgi:hypothetical protein
VILGWSSRLHRPVADLTHNSDTDNLNIDCHIFARSSWVRDFMEADTVVYVKKLSTDDVGLMNENAIASEVLFDQPAARSHMVCNYS